MRAYVSFTHPTGLNCVRGTAPLVPARSIRLKIDKDLTWDVNNKRLFTKVEFKAIESTATYTALDELLKQESTRKSFIKADERWTHENSKEYTEAHKNFYEAITATRTIAHTLELVTARSFCLTDLCRSGALDVFFVRL
eukprot:GHVU01145462.1.p1 GENE.GHVU01145462.1~~GHVU01145462.1.p1  ORF type:complete len:139 (-),score=6.85 GHVU01145462.1:288-704(-)